MRILVLGCGGREHALVWKLKQSGLKPTLFCTPGNAGIQTIAECPEIKLDAQTHFRELLDWVERQKIDLTVVGPEAILAHGVVDDFQARFGNGKTAQHRIFGPTQKAALLETSKIFAKNCLEEWKIPTAQSRECTSKNEVLAAAKAFRFPNRPVVLKADGLAAGKGVWVCTDEKMFEEALSNFFEKKSYGAAGDKILVEDFLEGEEVSFLAVCDGETAIPLATSQDHKRLLDADRGPNTGGMGAFSPATLVSPEVEAEILKRIVEPTLSGMRAKGTPFTGILYAGLMLTEDGPKVLEFNCRFGDPETQAVLMRLQTDLVEVIEAAISGDLKKYQVEPLKWDERPAVCIVLASQDYPQTPKIGDPIEGLEEVELSPELYVFHAGTAIEGGQYVTHGGRVLGVSALGEDLADALQKAYSAVRKISWAGMQYRRDIGQKGLRH